jgi:periplasmic protein TonB
MIPNHPDATLKDARTADRVRAADAVALLVSGALHGAAFCVALALVWQVRLPLPPFLSVELVDARAETPQVAPHPVPPRPQPARLRPVLPPSRPVAPPQELPSPVQEAQIPVAPAPAAPPVAPPATVEVTAPPRALAAETAAPRGTSPLDVPDSPNGTVAPGSRQPEGPAPVVAAFPSAVVTAPYTRGARPRGGYQVQPDYPAEARRAQAEGTTLLRVHVADDGRIDDVQVDTSAGHAALDRAAAEAVRKWRFEPARNGSVPVAVWVVIPVRFRLEREF